MYTKKDFQKKNILSTNVFNHITKMEKKSALDFNYWETKILHQVNVRNNKKNFEKDFINLLILSKNNKKKLKTLKLYYLRNIPRFSKEVADIVMSIN